MNLLLRMLWLLVMQPFRSRLGLLDPSYLVMRVLPNDLDINLHMNNGRYLTLLDLGRFDLVFRTGLARLMLRHRWQVVVGGALVRFRRPLAPLQRYRLTTQVIGWDERWVFVEQRFETRGGVACVALVKGMFLKGGQTVPPHRIVALAGGDVASPVLPDAIRTWLDAEIQLGNGAKAPT